jgi:spore coat protein A, manganese oxidase
VHETQCEWVVSSPLALQVPTETAVGSLANCAYSVSLCPPNQTSALPGRTIKAYSGYITRVIAKFDLPPAIVAKRGDEFRYAWHRQVLEHEDNEMMRPYKIVARELVAPSVILSGVSVSQKRSTHVVESLP